MKGEIVSRFLILIFGKPQNPQKNRWSEEPPKNNEKQAPKLYSIMKFGKASHPGNLRKVGLFALI